MQKAHPLQESPGCLQVDDLDLPVIGPVFERHEAFPARINTEFVQVSPAASVLLSSGCSTALHRRNVRTANPLCAPAPADMATTVAQVLDRSHVRMAVWERGAGQTLACGTGACATVVAGVLEGRVERKCRRAGPHLSGARGLG